MNAPLIQVLPNDVAEKIAAGEVIERPSSAIKELIENSLDAGATRIAVILEEGGKTLIEVIDNGAGMGPMDLTKCLLRHATSKLREMEDLERLHTLGFRGEALASIAASADVSILSRLQGATDAYELNGTSGETRKITFGYFLDKESGTRIQARDLFSKIPARRKFLKSNRSELMAVQEWMERFALSHPNVSFQLTHQDKLIFDAPAEPLEKRIQRILADGQSFPLQSHTQNEPGMTLYWLQGLSLPSTRKLVQIVNGRILKDRLLQQAMLSAFRQALLPGQFPALLLKMEVPPNEIDVNIHPTKTEVRFLRSQDVFRSVQSLAEQLIAHHGSTGYVPSASQEWTASEPRLFFPTSAPSSFTPSPGASSIPAFQSELPLATFSSPTDGTTVVLTESHPLPQLVFRGSVFQTYLLFEESEKIWMVDQHAAHERIRYEELQKAVFQTDTPPPSQELLLPEAIRVDALMMKRITERLPLLERMGFVADPFGENALVFRSIPAYWGDQNLTARLTGLVSRLTEADVVRSKLELDEALFEKLASEACHSAIRAGDVLEPEEAKAVFYRLFRCQHPWNCPHGRPTLVQVPRSRFEEWFQR